MRMTKKKCVRIFLLILGICAITILKISYNLMTLFTVKENDLPFCRETADNKANNRPQPLSITHIHQIFFNATEKEIPFDLEQARQSWVLRNKEFIYTLWNSKMALDLIKSEYPELLPVYESYSHWVRRADVLRYVLLYEYGGIYSDLDIGSKGNIGSLVRSLKDNTGVVLYSTKPVGVSNDFMIAKPRHPFFKHVICGLQDANRWFVLPVFTTIMSTGPGYLYAKYKTFQKKESIQIIDEWQLKPYIKHQDGGAWHGMDAKIIWWLFLQRKLLLKSKYWILIVFILILFMFKIRHRIVQLCRR